MRNGRTLTDLGLVRMALTGTLALGCVAVLGAGCGGSSVSVPNEDGGEDGSMSDGPEGKDSGKDAGKDSGKDASTGEKDGATHEAGEDSGKDASDGSIAPDGGTDGSTDGATDGAADGETDGSADGSADGATDGATDGPAEGSADAAEGSVGCTGSETACTLGSTAGLCVGGVCAACSGPGDDGNCTTAYADGGAYICSTSGSCVSGNCHADTDCAVSGEICGATTANLCGPCTTDSQCQTDPTYGPATICSTAATPALCVSSACTPASTPPSVACTANTSDICCAASNNSCVPGNCCANADCATSSAGSICGAETLNQCGKCTLDSQCGAGQVCDTTGDVNSGKCVSNACTTGPVNGGAAPGVCTENHADMCCGTTCTPNPTAGITPAYPCCPGTGANAYCKTATANNAAVCGANDVCTTCEAVSTSNPVYYVDPVHGSDSGTGSGATGDGGPEANCALQTLTRALELISVTGTSPAPEIVIVGATGGVTVETGETFPLTIPSNVTVTTETGPVTVKVPTGKAGFVLGTSSTLTSAAGALLTITTTVTANTGTIAPTGGTNAIQVNGATGVTLSNVTVNGMLDDGILVTAGTVAIGPGVASTDNGIMSTVRNGYTHAGLHVTGNGAATITGTSGAPTMFNGNSAHGILVDTNGAITLTGTPASGVAGTGTVVTNANSAAGVWISQTPTGTAPLNTVTGLVSSANFAGNGMRIVAGSHVTVRGSAFLANNANGLIVSTGAGKYNDISLIDLGDGTTAGGNTFQGTLGAGANGGVGLCLSIAPNKGQTLLAEGDTFRGIVCSTAETLLLNTKGCGNGATACAGGICDLGFGTAQTATTPNTFTVTSCTQ